jgi:O-antigen/teichoic acid export membrane protein
MGMGTGKAIIRLANQYMRDGRTGELIFNSQLINFVGGAIITVIITYLIKPIFFEYQQVVEIEKYILFICLSALFQSLFFNSISYFIAINSGTNFLISSILSLVSILISNIVFVIYMKMGIIGVLIAQVLSYFIVWIVTLIWILHPYKIKISYGTGKQTIRYGFPLIFSQTNITLYDLSIVYILGIYRTFDEIAIYSLANKIAGLTSLVLIGPIQASFEAFVFQNLNEKNVQKHMASIFKYYSFSFFVVSVGLIVLLKSIISIVAPNEYYLSYYLTVLLLPGYACYGLSLLLQTLIHINMKSRITGYIIYTFVLLNIIVQLIFIKEKGMFSAVIIFDLINILNVLVTLYFGLKSYSIKFFMKKASMNFCILIFLVCFAILIGFKQGLIFYINLSIIILITGILSYLVNFKTQAERAFFMDLFRSEYK